MKYSKTRKNEVAATSEQTVSLPVYEQGILFGKFTVLSIHSDIIFSISVCLELGVQEEKRRQNRK